MAQNLQLGVSHRSSARRPKREREKIKRRITSREIALYILHRRREHSVCTIKWNKSTETRERERERTASLPPRRRPWGVEPRAAIGSDTILMGLHPGKTKLNYYKNIFYV